MENDGPLLTIGELARRVGVPVRTIRFWSDSRLLPPAARTDGDRRLYDAACVARLELVSTLRELGLSLANVRRVLGGQVTAAEVAAIHLEALDTEIRALRLRRAVVAAVVKRSADGEEMGMINKLARLSAAERRQIIDDFTAEVFRGLDPSPARFARWAAAPDLPDDPSAEQVEAWVDLAELVADRGFREQVRQVAGSASRSSPAAGWPTSSGRRTRPRRPDSGECRLSLPKRPGSWRRSWRAPPAASAGLSCWPSWKPPLIPGSNVTGSLRPSSAAAAVPVGAARP